MVFAVKINQILPVIIMYKSIQKMIEIRIIYTNTFFVNIWSVNIN